MITKRTAVVIVAGVSATFILACIVFIMLQIWMPMTETVYIDGHATEKPTDQYGSTAALFGVIGVLIAFCGMWIDLIDPYKWKHTHD